MGLATGQLEREGLHGVAWHLHGKSGVEGTVTWGYEKDRNSLLE